MDVQLLLNEVELIRRKYEERKRATGAYFNIFSIAHIEHDEVRMCRIIKELIDPKGAHCQGAVYMKLFLEHVLKLDDALYADVNLENAVVEREKVIIGNRRIDLFITIPGRACIPIEVKLDAGDQDAQCSDYYHYAKNSPLYYLTLDRHMPSPVSLGTLPAKSVRPISFGSEILDWLSACLQIPETLRLTPIREIIRQLMDTLRKITNQMEDKMEADIVNLILQSKENLKNADLLAEAVQTAEQKILDKYFRELRKRIEEKYPWLLENFKEDELEENVEYDKSGIYYRIKYLKNRKYCLNLNITCGQWIYAGLDLYDKDDNQVEWQKHFKQEDIISGEWESDTYWPAWKYICEDKNSRPNFKYHNEAFYSLVEPEYFENYINKTMSVVNDLLGSLI